MDQQRFLQQLQVVLNPAQGNVKEATGILQREYYNQPESLVLLIQVATGHEDPNLRQLAAVEARSLVTKHWLKVQADQKPQIREQLVRSTLGEGSSLVRHSVARIISAVAKIDLNDGEWAELPNFLLQASASNNKEERVVGTYILFTILETLGEGFVEKYQDLYSLFQKTIRDPESEEVRINTLLALSKLAMNLDSDEDEAPVKAFQDFVPPMVAVLKDSIDNKQEDRVMQAFEVFQTLLGCDPALLTVHLKDLVVFMNELASNTEADEDTRTQAISFLMQCVQYRKLKIQGMRLGEQLTRSALQIVTELSDSPSLDDDITPPRSALGLLDMLAQSLPPSQVVVPLLNALGQYFNNSDPNYRRAGIMALGMCVEGAPDFISTQMKEIYPMVLQLLADPEPKVRQAALHAVARLADDLAEDLSAEHEKLMPLLFQNIASAMQEYKGEEEGPTVEIMKAGISAIDAVVDGLDEKEVAPYQGELVPILHKIFKHPDFRIKGLAAGALGSVASSAGDAFLPFFDESMHLLQEFATVKDSEEELDLRASVTDAMGEMAASAGPERYQPYVEPLMRATEEGLNLGHSRLKESTYIFWGAMAKVYVEHFAPFLDGVTKGVFACIEQDETDLDVSLGEAGKDLVGQEVTIGGRKVKVAAADDDDAEDGGIEDIDPEDEDEDAWDDITATTPLSLEKEIAVEVIGDLVTHTRSAFLPYFEKTIEMVLPLAEHPYEGVRKSAISTLHRSYAMLFAIAEEAGKMAKWQPGLPLQVQPAKEVKDFGDILMTATIKMWTEEDDRATVADINRNMAENLRYCGPALIANETTLHNVIQMITDIINKQHPSQIEFGEDEVAPEETSEFDWVVIDTALDVVSGMAAALGQSFAELWKVFEKTVLRYASSSESLERATAVGVLAECINGMGGAVTKFSPAFLKLLVHRLGDEDPQAKSNAAYAVGRLVEHSNDAGIVNEFPTILSKLENCLQMDVSRLQDNATGCLSRMILRHRENVPIKDVLPVLVNILPLKNDFEENDPLYRMICQLYKWEDPTVRELTPQFVPIFQAVLGDEDALEDERRAELTELVKWLNQMQPGVAPWADQL